MEFGRPLQDSERDWDALGAPVVDRHGAGTDWAFHAYLRTLEPVKHVVNDIDPPTPCAACGAEHGGGERNEAS